MHELKFMFSIKNIFLVQIITVSYDTFPGCYYFLYRFLEKYMNQTREF
jgi:hypothetical protein